MVSTIPIFAFVVASAAPVRPRPEVTAWRVWVYALLVRRFAVESVYQIPYNPGHYRHVLCTADKAACLSADRLGGDSSFAPRGAMTGDRESSMAKKKARKQTELAKQSNGPGLMFFATKPKGKKEGGV